MPGVADRRITLRDRFITAIARLLARAFYSSVEVQGPPPPTGPVILASSHLNGFVDPVLLVARLGFLPRFMAKATLWKNPVAGAALGFARAVPVHRRVDGETTANASMFDGVVAALADQAMVAVFPEGTTHDDPSIRELRTGAARIAILAAGRGVNGVRIVPCGISYEDKVAVRGRALVSYGQSIDVPSNPDLIDERGNPNAAAVVALTSRLQSDIEGLTPSFESIEEQVALTTAATVAVTGPEREPATMATIAESARELGRLDPTIRGDLVAQVATYAMLLGSVGVADRDLVDRVGLSAMLRRVAVLGAAVVILSPIAVAGLFANLVPLLAVLAIGLLVQAPVTKGTVRFLAAAVLFPLNWVVLVLLDASGGVLGDVARSVTAPVDLLLGSLPTDRTGLVAGLVVFVAVPLMGMVALVVIERAWQLMIAVVRWRTLVDRRGQLPILRANRSAVAARVTELLEGAT